MADEVMEMNEVDSVVPEYLAECTLAIVASQKGGRITLRKLVPRKLLVVAR
ncbi:hypothetical protein FEP54_06049 [Burkholderia multivorans]|nr:hypothetical protein [Burkholderia multivorans]MDR8927291.1 hypothetical protein [Burkholderia multivorans]MDR8968962.1 hypothetical protein [Burkholderia multivorans]MDR8993571.1 hypothetical protein [Burkholderia multivorans]MDR9024448.1 hypothetical protein [Burkholderia multivorans]